MAKVYKWALGLCTTLLVTGGSASLVLRAHSENTSAAPLSGDAGQFDRDVERTAAIIDRRIEDRWRVEKARPAEPARDAEFLRRVYLDLAGRIPSLSEAQSFLGGSRPEKRRLLVKQLLDNPSYVSHFTNVWRGLLLPEAMSRPELQTQTAQFDAWLRRQIVTNVAYDRMVRDLLTLEVSQTRARMATRPPPDQPTPLAFYLAKDVKPENLAASTARLFLGVRLECAQCHNHPFAHWKREQFWSYAAFFAGLQRQNQPDGNPGVIREIYDRRELAIPGASQVVSAAFLDGQEPRWKYRVGPRVTLADWMTAPENPYFARAGVNRLWGYFFGTGLVEPVDDLEGQNPPSHPELLNELAHEFAEHGFDWKFLIVAITSSRAYQLTSALTDPSQEPPHLFARMALRGLTAEQVYDSLAEATGYQAPVPKNPQPGVVTGPGPRAEFLTLFASRAAEKPTEAQTAIPEALALMNGAFVSEVTQVKSCPTLRKACGSSSNTEERVRVLYLASLSREPTPAELTRLVRYVDKGGVDHSSEAALADVFWALLNSGEFILNH